MLGKYYKKFACPKDYPLFEKLGRIATYVAQQEGLRRPYVRPKRRAYRSSYRGLCDNWGVISLIVRHKTDGQWEAERLSIESILYTLAHEIGHLRYLNHSRAFRAYEASLRALVFEAWENYRGLCKRGLMPKAA